MWVYADHYRAGEKMRAYIMIMLLLSCTPQAWAQRASAPEQVEGATRLSAEQVIALVLRQEPLVIVDSRKGQEYAKGHIEGAVNLPDTVMTRELLHRLTRSLDTPLLFYCNGVHCLRSSNAAKKAQQWGYRHIFWFRGGWNEWRSKQLPVSR